MAADYSWVNPTLRNVAGPGMLAQYGNRDLLTTMLGWADDQRIVRHRNITSTLRSGWQHRHRASEPLAVNRMNVGNLRAHYPDLLGDAMKAQATSTPFVNGEDGASADDDFKTDFLEFYRLYYGLSVQDGLALDAIIRNDDNIGRIFQWLVHYINRFLFWHQSVYLGAMKRTSGRNRTQLRHIQFRWIGRDIVSTSPEYE
ncbi:hypothetical protein F4778DRAFT_262428 [Xylariomycetidae sp. FL2044]|nr:hypothetical protein F4778DRAFT_262428 [Xylariomycetidae sp. FL2044]